MYYRQVRTRQLVPSLTARYAALHRGSWERETRPRQPLKMPTARRHPSEGDFCKHKKILPQNATINCDACSQRGSSLNV